MMTPSLTSASSTSSSQLSIQASKNGIPATPTGFNEFFFVLSASSPCDATLTPISPLKKGDIPDALLHLLPQPSNSLLDVVSITRLSGSLQLPSPGANLAPILRTEPISHHTHDASKKTPKGIRPLPPIPILLRDSTAAVPMSLAVTEPSNIPTSSRVEITSTLLPSKLPVSSSTHTHTLKPRYQPNSAHVSDPRSKVTHSHRSPVPNFASALRLRLRKRGRTDVVTPPSRVPLTPLSGHARGRNSPFPAPIQSDFAPRSVPGSKGTPYSYF